MSFNPIKVLFLLERSFAPVPNALYFQSYQGSIFTGYVKYQDRFFTIFQSYQGSIFTGIS